MSEILDIENINKVYNDEIIFKDQEVPFKDISSFGYNYIALTAEQKNLVSSIVNEVKDLAFQIINQISLESNIQRFFKVFLKEDAKNFFSLYKDIFIKKFVKRIEMSVSGGDYIQQRALDDDMRDYRQQRILDNNGEIISKDVSLKYISFNEFVKNLNKTKNLYIEYLNNLKNFSVQEILNKKGYNSLEEFEAYYQKYLELKKTPEYIDFFDHKNGASLLEKLDSFNIKNLIFTNLKFLISIQEPRNPKPIRLDINKESNFLLLDKYKIDNFKEFIDSYRVNVETELEKKYVDTHIYINTESEEDADRLNSHETIKNIINHYYEKNSDFSYENGLYYAYSKFIEKEILIPLYNQILDKYQKPSKIYGLDKINELSYESFLRDLAGAFAGKDSGYHNELDFSIFVKILTKKYVNRIPSIFFETLKREIFLASKENKTINIDSILKAIDSQFKNSEDSVVSLNLDLNKEKINKFINQLPMYFNSAYIQKVRSFVYKDLYTNTLQNLSEEDSKEIEKSLAENRNVNIRKFLSQEQMAYLALSERLNSSGEPHSYRESIERLDKKIEDIKKKYTEINFQESNSSTYYLKDIDKNSIIIFFNNLKKILLKQIQQEEQFLQKKSNSMGILDELKFNNISLKEVPIAIDLKFAYQTTFNMFEPFLEQFFSNFRIITNYFSVFPEEARAFFNLTDFNQIKNNIIKILNFANNGGNLASLNSIQELIGKLKFSRPDVKTMSPDIAETIEDFNINKLSGVEFLTKIFENKNIGTKKEKIEKFFQISKIIHNFSHNTYFINLLIKSKYFEKCYNKSISDVITTIGSSISYKNDSINILRIIKEKSPGLIPEGYLSEEIEYSIKNIRNIKSSEDLDFIIDKLMSGNPSENIKRFKYLLSLANDYAAIDKWINVSQSKAKEIFSPSFSTDTFRFRVLGDLDPYHFRVGVDTGCCQAIGNAGESAAIDSFINPKAGVLLLEVKTISEDGWRLAAQSYFHFAEVKDGTEVKKAILLDNIEAGKLQGLYKKDNFYPNAYAVLGSYLKNSGFDIVGCGTLFTKVIEPKDFEEAHLSEDPRHFEVEKHNIRRYSDFMPSYFLDLLKPKFSVQIPENITSIDSEMSVKSAAILEPHFRKFGNKKINYLYKLSRYLYTRGHKKEALCVNKLITDII
jgi:hypothetical protein